MGGAVMTDAGLACHATDCLGRHPPGQRNLSPNTIASRRDASGPPVDYLGDRGKEPESTSTPDPGGRAAGGPRVACGARELRRHGRPATSRDRGARGMREGRGPRPAPAAPAGPRHEAEEGEA